MPDYPTPGARLDIVKAGAAVNYYEAQLATAVEAEQRAELKVHAAEAAVIAAKAAHVDAVRAVVELRKELDAAHETLAQCEGELGLPTGQGGGAAFNPTIRIEENPD